MSAASAAPAASAVDDVSALVASSLDRIAPPPVRTLSASRFCTRGRLRTQGTLRLQICKSMRATPSATESLPVWQKRHRERRQPSSRRPADLHERPGNEMTTSRSRYLQFVGIRATYRINLAPEGRLPVAVLLGG